MLTTEQIQYYLSITAQLNRWGIIVTAIIGLFGNPLTAGIYLTKSFNQQSVRVYYPTILISDTIHLVIGTTPFWQYYLFGKNDIYCRVITYLGNMLPIFSSWVLTILSIDRALSTFFPNRFFFLRKMEFQFMALFVSFIFPSILVLQLVIQSVEAVYFVPEWQCVYIPPPDYDTKVYFYVFGSFYALIPFTIMLISSIIMVFKLRQVKKNASTVNLKRSNRFIGTILGLNFYFLVALLPYIVTNVTFLILESLYIKLSIEQYFFLNVFSSISYLFLWIFYSTSFVLHLICNKLFRKVLMTCVIVKTPKISF